MQSKDTGFRLWSPFDIVEKGDSESTRRGRIVGIASSEALDEDEEVIVQKGLDWTWFLSKGFISLEHPLGVHNIVGEPINIEPAIIKGIEATKLTCDLLLDDPAARSIYEKAKTLKKAKSNRKLGFSIEGRILDREDHVISKAQVVSVAISAVPKNPLTWFEPIMASAMWRSLVGYPLQGVGYSSDLASMVPQSMQGVTSSASYSVSDKLASKELAEDLTLNEILAARLLRKLPHMSWSQGMASIKEIRSSD